MCCPTSNIFTHDFVFELQIGHFLSFVEHFLHTHWCPQGVAAYDASVKFKKNASVKNALIQKMIKLQPPTPDLLATRQTAHNVRASVLLSLDVVSLALDSLSLVSLSKL
jgi:hypothetical protein